MKEFFESLVAIIGATVIIVLLFLIIPLFIFAFGWVAGWLTKIAIGDTLCNALNIVFNVSYFTPDKLPMIGGALGWIGSFFKATINKKNK